MHRSYVAPFLPSLCANCPTATRSSLLSSLRAMLPALLFAASAQEGLADAVPVFSDTGPDAAAYGAAQNYPVGGRRAQQPQDKLVGTYSHYDQIYKFHRVAKPATPSTLRYAAKELVLDYTFRDASYSLADYLQRNPATGLLIARRDGILFEHYLYARRDSDRLVSQSMAKTVTSMLLGIAVSEGAIRSIDDPAAAYVPGLADTEYGKTSIRALLHMSSGVSFREKYDDPTSDNAKLGRALFGHDSPGPAKALATFDARAAPEGTRFNYAGADTEVLGLVVANAVHMPLSHYLESRIWQPMGAEADATWVTDFTDHEVAYCCVSATLRDWARLALLLAHDGRWNDRQIIPRQCCTTRPRLPRATTTLHPRG